MKTIKTVIQENSEFKTLINAVLSRIDKDLIQDINNYGIQGGFGKFVYYSDTLPFAHRYKKLINQLLDRDSEEFGIDVVEMVSGFGHFRNNPMDSDDKKDLYRFLSGAKCKGHIIPNLMAWYAAETVCRWFED
jgi:histidine ammonia-lyase